MPVSLFGLTQASSVIPVLNWSNEELGMPTKAFVPLNEIAFPYFPEVVHNAPPCSVPLCLLPDASFAVVPLPSLNPYAATKPDTGGVTVGVGVGVGVGLALGVDVAVGVGVGVGL